jgi:peptidoglycan/LPS O-acetylase OafA/YrhL
VAQQISHLQRSSGFDILRYAALGMVVWQHVQSLHGVSPRHLLPGLDVGQLGVTVFCAMSGYFALGVTSDQSPWRWLGRRLERIYIPLWLTLVPLFVANAILGDKQASLSLILSEFAGTGFLTHGSQLVGVHLWFISLILISYLLAVPVRRFPILLPLLICCTTWGAWQHTPLSGYLLVFLLAGAVRRLSLGAMSTICLSAAVAGASWLAGPRGTVLLPSVVGLCAVAISQCISGCFQWPERWSWTTKASEGSYHFYLAHGPVFYALAMVGWFGLALDIVVGMCLTILASAGLYVADAGARHLLHRWLFASGIK